MPFALLQVEHLFEITSELEVGNVFDFEHVQRLINLLTVMFPKLLFHLVIKLRKLKADVPKDFFSNGEAGHICLCPINELISLLETRIKATNIR